MRDFLGTKRDKLNGTNAAKFAVFRRFSLIFADFRSSGNNSIRRCRISQKTAGNHRFSQETADFCRNPFVPFSLSLLTPPYSLSFQGKFVWTDGAERSSKLLLRLVLVHGWLFPVVLVLVPSFRVFCTLVPVWDGREKEPKP